MQIVNDTVKFSEEEFHRLSGMLRGIAWKYNGWSGLEADDIEMELWITALNVIKGTEESDLSKIINLIASCCYNRAIDLCRAAKRSSERSFAASDILEVFGNGNTEDDYQPSSMFSTCHEDHPNSAMYLEEMINLFDPGSRERKYIILVILYLGLDEYLTNRDSYPSFSNLFGYERMELEIAKLLGYANDTSQGYRKLKGRVRAKLESQGFDILEYSD